MGDVWKGRDAFVGWRYAAVMKVPMDGGNDAIVSYPPGCHGHQQSTATEKLEGKAKRTTTGFCSSSRAGSEHHHLHQ